MRASIITALTAAAVVNAQSPAPAVTDNPSGSAIVATLPNSDSTTIRGSVYAKSGANGAGVDFTVNFSGLPSEGGPFLYHIHVDQVPADGNCTATMGHLDPENRGETPPCDPTQPATCQVGDLSGKHGAIKTSPTFSASYNDAYDSLVPGTAAYIGNRSIVVHFANKTRITCANFQMASSYNTSTTTASMPTGTGAPTASQSGYMSGAGKIAGSSAAVLVALAAAFL